MGFCGNGGCRSGSEFQSDKVLVGSYLNKVGGWLWMVAVVMVGCVCQCGCSCAKRERGRERNRD